MDLKKPSDIVRYGLPLIGLGLIGLAFILYGKGYDVRQFSVQSLFEKPCEKPIVYSIGAFDERFGVSKSDFETMLKQAATLWNTEAGRELITYKAEGGIPVNLVYSEHQQAANLGKTITTEQQGYNAKKKEVEESQGRYQTMLARYDSRNAAYEKRSAAYERDVDTWNARGGAPPAEYERLNQEKAYLKKEEAALNALGADLNDLVDQLNARVDELNALAAKTNSKVNEYNGAVGDDFDQGTYIEDAEGKRINIYEFMDRTELKRVLAHEFGHALGFDHVENPESIMYSYNVGTALTLSAEDKAEYLRVCRVKE